ncbi:hypothetical protein MTP99_000727 [Tenebrio molitor]|nr:hypothetical protein MTP99_000727 [Tenebrio molitor]
MLNLEERALEICEFNNMSTTPTMGARHLSKSTSELSSPREMPEIRPRSAAPPETSHLSVYQKAHSFFAQLKMMQMKAYSIIASITLLSSPAPLQCSICCA